MAPQTWLITGCSSGFGAEFVHQLRALGDNVIATGRNARTKLAHLEDTGASIIDLDVTAPGDVIATKVEEAWGINPGGIDVVVNNAGYILSAAFEELTQKDLEDVFKTNFHGPLNITRALLPKLRAKGTGTLLFMSSRAAWHADPSATGCCSTKFALEGAVECLAKELAIFAPGLKVLLVEPGYFRTRAFSNINHVAPRIDVYSEFNAVAPSGTSITWHCRPLTRVQVSRLSNKSVVGNKPGDSTKAVTRMIELTKGTGMAADKTIPLRVPLGTDGWTRVKDKCEEMLKICEEWEDVAKSTDVQQ